MHCLNEYVHIASRARRVCSRPVFTRDRPAGLVAKEIVRYSAEVIKSLYDDHGKDADSYIKNEILPCLFHPMFVSGSPGEPLSDLSRGGRSFWCASR